MTSTKTIQTRTSNQVRITTLPEGGYVVSVPNDHGFVEAEQVVAVTTLDELLDWLETSASAGEGFVTVSR